jgi:hypothetical protein
MAAGMLILVIVKLPLNMALRLAAAVLVFILIQVENFRLWLAAVGLVPMPKVFLRQFC